MRTSALIPIADGHWEVSFDLGQWMIGLNGGTLYGHTRYFNIFFGPFRLGWYSDL